MGQETFFSFFVGRDKVSQEKDRQCFEKKVYQERERSDAAMRKK